MRSATINVIGMIEWTKMDKTCSKYREEECMQGFLKKKTVEKRSEGRTRHGRDKILRQIMEKQNGEVWIGFI
jgi:hypothetical protein